MGLLEFLALVLPGQGFYYAATSGKEGHQDFRLGAEHGPAFFSTLRELADYGEAAAKDARSPHFGVAAFKLNRHNQAHAAKSEKVFGRTRQNVREVKCFVCDIDVRPEGGAAYYASQKQAVDALMATCSALNLPAPTVIWSGSGLHAYWPLTRALPYEDWQPLATGVKAALIGANLKLDAGKTGDATAMFRMPGFQNQRRRNQTRIISVGPISEPEEFERFRAAAAKSTIAGKAAGTDNYRPTFAAIMRQNCAQVALFAESGGDFPEPFGHAVLSNVNKCQDKELGDEWCKGDRYDPEWVKGQLARTEDPPSGCSFIEGASPKPEACAACPHKGHIKNPLQAAYQNHDQENPEYDPIYTEWKTDSKGKIRDKEFWNCMKAVRRLDRLNKFKFEYNEFHHYALINGERISDSKIRAIRDYIMTDDGSRGFDGGKETIREAIYRQCETHRINPVREWVDNLQWDGTCRIEEWMIKGLNVDDSPFVREISKKILIALVARIRRPGCMFDAMIVLEGYQGHGKTSAVKILANGTREAPDNPAENFYGDQPMMDKGPREQLEHLEGKIIVEVPELSGMRRTEVEELKAFCSRQTDQARKAYGHEVEQRGRTCVFFATTNDTQYLRDATGGRRFWPVKCKPYETIAKQEAALQWLADNRDQLIAEAAQLDTVGTPLSLSPDHYDAARQEQEKRRAPDPWECMIKSKVEAARGEIEMIAIYEWLRIDPVNASYNTSERIKNTMRAFGWLPNGTAFKRIAE